jgi:alanine racemase
MISARQPIIQPRRDAWVEVDLGAIEHNTRVLRKAVPADVDLMAVVKADAYGHGASMIIPTLEALGVKMLGVASMDEAIQLRQSGIRLPILVIGLVPDWSVQYAADYDIHLTIFDQHQLTSLEKAFRVDKKPFKVHIKVDTGLHRIGVDWEEAASFVNRCYNHSFLSVEGVFSHLANSVSASANHVQLTRWLTVLQQLVHTPRYVHIANSGYVGLPDAFQEPELAVRHTMARVGIALFGYGEKTLALKPAMGVKARIISLRTVAPDSGVSYGPIYRTPAHAPSCIATVPLGYADGIPLNLSGKIEGLMGGYRLKQVGRITMDQMMFDVTHVPDITVGSTITLLGQQGDQCIWLDTWAALLSTIEYELMCGLRVRLPKTYTR